MMIKLTLKVRVAERDLTCHSILKFFQVDITGMFRMTSSRAVFQGGGRFEPSQLALDHVLLGTAKSKHLV